MHEVPRNFAVTSKSSTRLPASTWPGPPRLPMQLKKQKQKNQARALRAGVSLRSIFFHNPLLLPGRRPRRATRLRGLLYAGSRWRFLACCSKMRVLSGCCCARLLSTNDRVVDFVFSSCKERIFYLYIYIYFCISLRATRTRTPSTSSTRTRPSALRLKKCFWV